MNRHDGTFITGVLLLVLSDLAVRSLGFLVLKVAERLAVVAAGVYFLTSRSQWTTTCCPSTRCLARPGSSWPGPMLTSRLMPPSLSVLGIVGYAALLLEVVCDLLGIADLAPASGAGIAFLIPGGLFELAFPLLLTVRGSCGRSDARLVPISAGGAG